MCDVALQDSDDNASIVLGEDVTIRFDESEENYFDRKLNDLCEMDESRALFSEEGPPSRKRTKLTSSSLAFDEEDADIDVVSQARIIRLESEKGRYQNAAKHAQVEMEKARERAAEMERASESRIQKLEEQRRILLTRQETLKEELEETRDKSEREKRQLELQVRLLKEEKENLRKNIEKAWEAAEDQSGRMDSFRMKQLESESLLQSKLKTELEQCRKQVATSTFQIATLEVSNSENEQRALTAEHRVEELERRLELNVEKVKAVEQSHKQLIQYNELERKCRALEKENVHLKKVSDSCALLREQIVSLENKLKRAEERLVEATKLELDNQALKKLCQQWETPGALGGVKFRSPSEMTTMLADLQRKEVVLSGQNSQLKADLNISAAALKATREQVVDCEQKLAQEKEKSKKDSETVKRLERKAHYLKMDRDHIRQILKSYETDMESSETKVESDLLAARKEIQNLWKTIEELQMKLEAKDEANETRDDPSKEKIFRYSGPESVHDVEMAKHESLLALLKKDNEDLRAQLKAVTTQGKPTDAKPVANVGLQFEVAQLTEKLQKEETSRARLKEAMKATVKGYRDVVHDVLGYKIELLPDSGMCALRSIYAEKPDDVVKLKVGKGNVLLIDTPFSSELPDHLVETYLKQHRSFPSFFAGITLDLISRQTLML